MNQDGPGNVFRMLGEALSLPGEKKASRQESVLFLLVILLELAVFVYLLVTRRVMGGHDGIQFFTLQYYFLNSTVTSGEVPLWLPFTTQGTVGTWWYAVQGGLLQNLLLQMGSLPGSIDFLTLFNIGIFIEELLLLVGVWLLARRFFVSPLTLFFVATTVMGTCVWASQPWWNFHFYYAVPLILHYLHVFLESGKWRYCFLAANLAVLQCLGNLPYFLTFISFLIFVYFVLYIAFNFTTVWEQLRRIRWRWPALACGLSIGGLSAALYAALSIGTDEVRLYDFGRDLDATTSLEGFLAYGGKLNALQWEELLFGISPSIDQTLYIGLFSLLFGAIGLAANLKREYLHLYFLTVVLLLFGMGTLVARVAYYAWPLMKYYRHLVLVSPFLKLFFCFLAGVGFEVLCAHSKQNWRKNLSVLLAALGACMLVWAVVLFGLAQDYESSLETISNWMWSAPSLDNLFNLKVLSWDFLQDRLYLGALIASIAGLCMWALLLITSGWVSSRKGYWTFLIGVILSVHLVDLYAYKVSDLQIRTFPLNEEQYRLTAYQPMPYAPRRDRSFWQNNPRVGFLIDEMESEDRLVQEYGRSEYDLRTRTDRYGMLNVSMYSFLFKDELGQSFRTDYWLAPLDRFMRAYWGQSIHEPSVPPAGLAYYAALLFPEHHVAAVKLAGHLEDKIQFFTDAYCIDSEQQMAALMTHQEYAGDVLFVSCPGDVMRGGVSAWPLQQSLASNDRIQLPYRIEEFSANHLSVSVENAQGEGGWMFYSDVWHPFWEVDVNGSPGEVLQASLAYKAVRLEEGSNDIRFSFRSRSLVFLGRFFALNSAVWLLLLLGWVVRIGAGEKADPKG